MDLYMRRIRPYEGSEPYIFISYSHRDSDKVLPLLQMLEDAGFRFWYDEGIDPGTEWPESIATHLEKSKVCLAFISPEYSLSSNCRREINFALSRNLDFLSVMLEPTRMTAGMEMQISSYMSLVSYKYPTREEFFEKLCGVELLQPCRGPAKQGGAPSPAARPAAAAKAAPAKTQKKNNLWIKLLVPILALGLVGYFVLSRTADKPKDSPAPAAAVEAASVPSGNTAVIEEAAAPSGDSAPVEEAAAPSDEAAPAEEALAPSDEAAPAEEALAPSDEAAPAETQEEASAEENRDGDEYRRLAYGTWTYGSIAVYASGDKSLHIELEDNRVPYGYPMSETPGNNEAYWNVQLVTGMTDSIQLYMNGTEDTASMQALSSSLSYIVKGNSSMGGFLPYSLEGNTFLFDFPISDSFPYTADDIQIVYVNLGTQAPSYTDHYEIFPD